MEGAVKVIFLDIDGVLNSARSVIAKMGPTFETSAHVRRLAELDKSDFENGLAPNQELRDKHEMDVAVRLGLLHVDPVCVALVNSLLTEAQRADSDGVALVLSSSHRMFMCSSRVPFGSDRHLERLRLYLTAMGVKVPEIFSITPIRSGKRGDEIQGWLDAAYERGYFDDDDSYVVLDDNSISNFHPHVKVDPAHGLSYVNYAEACPTLNLPEPGPVFL